MGMAMGLALRICREATTAAEGLTRIERVDLVAIVSGRHDLLVTTSAGSLAELAVVADAIGAVPGVRRTRDWIHLQTFREAYRPGGLASRSLVDGSR
ncbi:MULTISPECIES: Lrp/AsnC ligand binding domain-containing protein [unclassified Pseudonocardia]|uniref:Lrp/AsnC ligand binding domain-containing protein n=1 Tax=unclassified Pseudonocardia TaxID=2619320 RepID=UPI0011AE2142|nr:MULTISPECIES: Lrp/AsnC ligand binding domain-containing protein [unclassified Pseudonocardia]